MKFEKASRKVMQDHKQLYEDLALVDTLEYDITEYILKHKEGFKDKLDPLRKTNTDLFPDTLYEIYAHQFENVALKLIKDEVTQAFNLDPENSMRVTIKLIKQVASDVLQPTRR